MFILIINYLIILDGGSLLLLDETYFNFSNVLIIKNYLGGGSNPLNSIPAYVPP